MKSLKSLLEKKKGISKIVFTDKDVFYIFTRVVKEEFGNIGAGKFTPEFFKNKTIFVRCASPMWASELFLNREKIIKKMNKELGEESIRGIKTK